MKKKRGRRPEIGLLPEEVIVLASIVRRNKRYKPEYGTVASVYLNRLRTGMPLQAEYTVKVCIRGHVIKESPKGVGNRFSYNTYMYRGLPRDRSDMVSDVIGGVLNAPSNNYLYFLCHICGRKQHFHKTLFRTSPEYASLPGS